MSDSYCAVSYTHLTLPTNREVSTLTVLFGTTEALLGTITAAGAAALLVFCLLYTPCVAAVASIKRELGGKWAFFVVIGQCVIAWLAAFAVHTVAMLF